jgi:hypothetical protein
VRPYLKKEKKRKEKRDGERKGGREEGREGGRKEKKAKKAGGHVSNSKALALPNGSNSTTSKKKKY